LIASACRLQDGSRGSCGLSKQRVSSDMLRPDVEF
jgi:hypothetical protein